MDSHSKAITQYNRISKITESICFNVHIYIKYSSCFHLNNVLDLHNYKISVAKAKSSGVVLVTWETELRSFLNLLIFSIPWQLFYTRKPLNTCHSYQQVNKHEQICSSDLCQMAENQNSTVTETWGIVYS